MARVAVMRDARDAGADAGMYTVQATAAPPDVTTTTTTAAYSPATGSSSWA